MHHTQLGASGSPLYSLSLTIFYLCAIKFNVKDARFRQSIEPYLHAVSNIWAWFSAIFVLSTGYINNAGSGCWIAPYPEDCAHNAEVDCIRGWVEYGESREDDPHVSYFFYLIYILLYDTHSSLFLNHFIAAKRRICFDGCLWVYLYWSAW